MLNDKGIENLRYAIVMAAAKEYLTKYKQYLRLIKREASPLRIKGVKGDLISIERFFRSAWFDLLCDIDPEFLIRTLRNKASSSQSKLIDKPLEYHKKGETK